MELTSNDWASQYRIMAIDPGSDTLGLSLLTVDLRTGIIAIEHSSTYEAARYLRYLPAGYVELHGEMLSRLHCHQRNLDNMLSQFAPHTVIAESSFLKKRFPHSFRVLELCQAMIRQSLAGYDPSLRLELVDPMTAKKTVGVIGKATKDKGAVRTGVINYPGLVWNIDPTHLDEHSTDSLAIGIYKALIIRSEFACQRVN